MASKEESGKSPPTKPGAKATCSQVTVTNRHKEHGKPSLLPAQGTLATGTADASQLHVFFISFKNVHKFGDLKAIHKPVTNRHTAGEANGR